MIKQYVFHETLDGFNEDVIIMNKPTALKRATNADMETKPGNVRRRKGYKRLGAQVVDNKTVLGLFDFLASSGTRYPLLNINVANDATSKIVRYTGGAWTDSLLTTLTASKSGRFENFIGYAFFTNGEELYTSADGHTWGTSNLLNTIAISSVSYANPVVTLTVPSGHGVLAGDSITVSGLAPAGYNGTFTVTSVTATTVLYSAAGLGALSDTVGSLTVQFALAANDVVEYQNVLFLVGLKGYRSDIMWSGIPTKTDFSSAYTINWTRLNNTSIRLGDGEELIAGVKYRGALFFFKNSSISRTIYPIESNGVKELTSNIGANCKECIQVVAGQMLFFCDGVKNAKKGVYSYNSLADAEPQIISEPMQAYIDGMTANQKVVAGSLNYLYLVYIGAVSNAKEGITMNNCVLVFNAITNRWLGAWDLSDAANVMARLTQSGVTKLYLGDKDGQVWTMNEGAKDQVLADGTGGKAISLYARSHNLDISGQNQVRANYIKRSVKNIFIFGENLNHVKFRYRFDKGAGDTDGWTEVAGLRSPVHTIPIQRIKANLFQYEFVSMGDMLYEPDIRKIIVDIE